MSEHNLANPRRYWKGKKFSEEHRQKLSEAKKGKSCTNGFQKGTLPWNKDKPTPCLWGSTNGLWKGGKCSSSLIWRNRVQNRLWRETCLERDDHKCQTCGNKEKLHVHHIKSWNDYPELRFEISNGQTLCISCHSTLHWKLKTEAKLVEQ